MININFGLWVYDNCPNRRVAHLMVHSKSHKIRKKNFHRAIKDIIKDHKKKRTLN